MGKPPGPRVSRLACQAGYLSRVAKQIQSKLTRALGAAALLAAAGTFLAARIDFVRRHQPGVAPARYWVPQLTHIWLPGLALTAVFGSFAYFAWRRQ